MNLFYKTTLCPQIQRAGFKLFRTATRHLHAQWSILLGHHWVYAVKDDVKLPIFVPIIKKIKPWLLIQTDEPASFGIESKSTVSAVNEKAHTVLFLHATGRDRSYGNSFATSIVSNMSHSFNAFSTTLISHLRFLCVDIR
jgi:hypothetical protein